MVDVTFPNYRRNRADGGHWQSLEPSQSRPVASLGRTTGLTARRLALDILSGRYQPGQGLPKEQDSTKEFDISRSGYREVICVLASKGLIESRQKAGTRVCAREQWNLLDPDIQGWLQQTTPSPPFIKSLFELRLIVEPAAAELAAVRRTEDDIRLMQDALQAMKIHTLTTDDGRDADCAFHRALIRSAQNESLSVLSASIEAAVNWTTRLKTSKQISMEDPIPGHERVFDAIRRSDANAAKWCMEALIRTALEDTRRALG